MLSTTNQVATYLAAYKQGNEEAGKWLLQQYHGFIYKYYRVLTQGEYNPMDRHVVAFLNLLGNTNPSQTAGLLKHLLRTFDHEDLWQECVVAFFETAEKGDNLSHYYRYVLCNRVKDLLSQIIPLATLPGNVELEDLKNSPSEEELDARWVEGWTAHLFYSLTKEERQFIFWVWQEQIDTEELCKRMCISPRTLYNRKKEMREKLATMFRISNKK